jgi:outer membrane protein assembly factor BamA
VTACQTPDSDSQPNSGTGDGEDDAATVDLRTASQLGPLLASANPDQIVLPRLAGNQPVTDASTADLSLTMSTNALSPKAGDVITVSLQVSNRGGSSASSIEVQTQLPASWQLASTDGLVVSGQTIKGYINQLPAGKSATINLSLRVGGSNNVLRSQIADVAEPDPDSTPGNGYDKGEDDEASIMVRQR